MDIELSDIIVSHLGPFAQVDTPKDDDFQLEIVLQNSTVKIKVTFFKFYKHLSKLLGPQKAKSPQINYWPIENRRRRL